MSNTIAGIDPAFAKETVFAWRVGRTWKIRRAMHDGCDAVIAEMAADGITVAAIEDQFLGCNPLSFRRLVQASANIQSAAIRAGLNVRTVPAATWQPAMLTVGKYTPKRSAELKRLSVFRAQGEGAQVQDDDEADAVCICAWAAAQPDPAKAQA